MQNLISISYQGEMVTIETVLVGHDIQFKVNFDHPVFLEKELDEEGAEYWIEVGIGATLRAKELGEIIEEHPEFI